MNILNNDELLHKMHRLELMIANEFKRICDKNDLKYFLTAGSTLGAIRHKGFIPWDDDMDFGMLRADYEEFIEVCKKDLDDKFYLLTWDTDSNYPLPFAKIILKGTHVDEGFSKSKYNKNNGIYIDIFPFDNVPDTKISRSIQSIKYYLYYRIMWMKKGYGTNMLNCSVKQKIKYYIFKFFAKLCNYENTKKKFKKCMVKYNCKKTNKVVTRGSYSYKKESILREWVDRLVLVDFEDTKFLTYFDYEQYLTYFYGDYMKFPPEEKRNKHFRISVDFGIYE